MGVGLALQVDTRSLGCSRAARGAKQNANIHNVPACAAARQCHTPHHIAGDRNVLQFIHGYTFPRDPSHVELLVTFFKWQLNNSHVASKLEHRLSRGIML